MLALGSKRCCTVAPGPILRHAALGRACVLRAPSRSVSHKVHLCFVANFYCTLETDTRNWLIGPRRLHSQSALGFTPLKILRQSRCAMVSTHSQSTQHTRAIMSLLWESPQTCCWQVEDDELESLPEDCDYLAWLRETAERVRSRQLSEQDLNDIAEELECRAASVEEDNKRQVERMMSYKIFLDYAPKTAAALPSFRFADKVCIHSAVSKSDSECFAKRLAQFLFGLMCDAFAHRLLYGKFTYSIGCLQHWLNTSISSGPTSTRMPDAGSLQSATLALTCLSCRLSAHTLLSRCTTLQVVGLMLC